MWGALPLEVVDEIFVISGPLYFIRDAARRRHVAARRVQLRWRSWKCRRPLRGVMVTYRYAWMSTWEEATVHVDPQGNVSLHTQRRIIFDPTRHGGFEMRAVSHRQYNV